MNTEPNFADKTIWTKDNLPVMRGMNSGSVDLIYLDPPFNSKADYAAPIGSEAEGAVFKDTWSLSDINEIWLDLIEHKHPDLHKVIMAALTNSDKSYLIYMAVRLLEMRRVLKKTGSIYLHCDTTMSHYLKLVMDAVFGRKQFRNEIIWYYSGWNKTLRAHMERRHDIILFYANSNRQTFVYPTRPWRDKQEYLEVRKQKLRTDESGREYVLSDAGGGKRVRRYIEEALAYGVPLDDVWAVPKLNNSDKKERTGYPTQKPLALLERIIKTSSKEGDMVFDPFCGCATTMVAADRLQRSWAGIDVSEKAVELVIDRIKSDQGLFQEIIPRKDIPRRTDLGRVPKYNSTENKRRLYGEQEGHCNGCQQHFEARHLEVDHIITRADGGTGHIENLQLLCANCNRVKGRSGHEYLIKRLNARPRYRYA